MDINAQKGICLVIFFLVTLVPGVTTVLLFSRCQKRLTSRAGTLVISLLKCFAGGVFLSTCLLSLLDEGLDEYEDFKDTAAFRVDYPFFHLGIGVGFFLVAYMERLAFCITSHHDEQPQQLQLQQQQQQHDAAREEGKGEGVGEREKHRKGEDVQMENFRNKEETNQPQGTVAARGEAEANTEFNESGHTTDLTPAVGVSFKETPTPQNDHHYITATTTAAANDDDDDDAGASTDDNDDDDDDDDHHHHHAAAQRRQSMRSEISIEEEERTSGIRAIIFLLALSFHTLFDGLAVGLQDTDSDIWAMTVAIVIHKVIMVTSLALELSVSIPDRPVKIVLLLLLFALMTPVGVAVGMSVTSGHVNLRAQLLVGSILQAVAAGSVLYVTFFEILSEELGHHSSVTKVSVTLVGFAAIAVAKIWDTD